MKPRNISMKYGAGLLLLALSTSAMADLDFSGVTSAVSVSTIVAAITALAALKVAPGFAKWGYNKVIGWFK